MPVPRVAVQRRLLVRILAVAQVHQLGRADIEVAGSASGRPIEPGAR